MKFYIAARFGMKEEVKEIYKKLQEKGHEIVGDWTLHLPIKPYDQNQEMSKNYSEEDIQGVLDCDVFLLITDGAGTGMYVELGAAIASFLQNKKPSIYAIGEHNSRSMFYFHPVVKRRDTVEEVLDEIK